MTDVRPHQQYYALKKRFRTEGAHRIIVIVCIIGFVKTPLGAAVETSSILRLRSPFATD